MKFIVLGSLCFILIQWISEAQAIGIRFSHNGVEMEYNRRNPGDRSEREYVCECKCYSKVLKDGWDCCDCPWTESVCFPGDVMVTVEPDNQIKMSELKPKDRVLAVTKGGKKVYSEVRTFLKRLQEDLAVYLDVITVDGQMISLSESHVIFSSSISNSSSFTSTFAGRLNIGDYIYTTDNCHTDICSTQVKHIQRTVRQGAYVPLTEEGTIVVNNIMASCYSSVDHNLGHLALTPIRWYPGLLGNYQGEGYSPFVKALKMIGHLILPEVMQYDMTLNHVTSFDKSEF
ncbi:hypothetical protein LOTGIDRAFT_236513 [Lottia gigantea]|uniref:Hint domain-containing protein n=1 Tax=Lottia gigantea TaxID=225164 RepID=V3YZP0_LOTGI|nr:hypothetical protein LOTGIDRAFT_236513 [Lottia gigantea]ESO83678.1 hypothetical protein LOTGIDRAFT_236513 [Lottia gigantea]